MEVTSIPDWLHPLLSSGNCRSFYTSRGKTSDPSDPYSGFNLCHYTGDDPKHISSCISKLSDITGITTERIIIPTQIHSGHVETINRIPFAKERLDGCDGLVTDQKNVIIGVNTADCLPIVLIDSHKEIIGIAHAGWRGILGDIIENTVSAMHRLGSSSVDISYSIGPSICAGCFEVGLDVATLFPEEVVSYPVNGRKPHVDLQRYAEIKLTDMGIAGNHDIFRAQSLCSRHNNRRFFSARASGIKSGRIFTFAYII